MSRTPRNPQFEAHTRASFARQGAMQFLGAQMVCVKPGYVEIRLPIRPELTQQNGYVHAGIIAAIADSAGGYAAFALFPENSDVLTLEFKVNLLEPAQGDALLACGTLIRPGRLSVTRVDVYAESGAERILCSIMQQTLMRVERSRG